MNTEAQPQPRELYLLSARGSNAFAIKTAGMELVAELREQKYPKSLDIVFFDSESVATLAQAFCNKYHINSAFDAYEGVLRSIDKMPSDKSVIAYLTKKEDGELKSMAEEAVRQGLCVEARTRTKY